MAEFIGALGKYALAILSNGNVGIGSSTPYANLAVAGSANQSEPIMSLSTSTASATSTAFIIDNNGKVGIGTSSPTNQLEVAGNGFLSGILNVGGSGMSTMAGGLTIGGNVAIGGGTTNPLTALDVNGTASTTDFITKGPWVDVRAYGAKCDGVTDDTAAIQSAINNSSAGANIQFPVGACVISNTLWVSKSMTLSGISRQSVIKFGDGLSIPEYTDMIKVEPNGSAIDGVSIHDLTINGNSGNTTQIGQWDPGIEIEASSMKQYHQCLDI